MLGPEQNAFSQQNPKQSRHHPGTAPKSLGAKLRLLALRLLWKKSGGANSIHGCRTARRRPVFEPVPGERKRVRAVPGNRRLQKRLGMRKIPSLKKRRSEHGGSFSVKSRRSRRPLNTDNPVHLVLRSEIAFGERSLKRNRRIVLRTLFKFSKRFKVKVYEKAVCSNHIHCVVKAPNRRAMQNFFRVFAGQVAQEILQAHPLNEKESAERGVTQSMDSAHPKNRRSFWALLAYTRIVRWGFDFRTVLKYVVRNTLETERIIPYKPRQKFAILVVETGPAGGTQRIRRSG